MPVLITAETVRTAVADQRHGVQYEVVDERVPGLRLSVNAPRRDPRSCGVLAAAKAKPSNLVFTHEPVMEATEVQPERRVMARAENACPPRSR